MDMAGKVSDKYYLLGENISGFNKTATTFCLKKIRRHEIWCKNWQDKNQLSGKRIPCPGEDTKISCTEGRESRQSIMRSLCEEVVTQWTFGPASIV